MTKIIYMVVGNDYDAQTIDSLWFKKHDAEARLNTVKSLTKGHYPDYSWFLDEMETEDDPFVSNRNSLLHDDRFRKEMREAESRHEKSDVLSRWATAIRQDTFRSLAEREFAGEVIHRILRIIVNDARRKAGMPREGDWK